MLCSLDIMQICNFFVPLYCILFFVISLEKGTFIITDCMHVIYLEILQSASING